MSIIDTFSGTVIGAWSGIQDRLGAAHASARMDTFDVVDLMAVPVAAWADLAARAVEPNAFFHPVWARAMARTRDGEAGVRALLAWDGPARSRLIGLLPVISAWHALRLPIPVMVAWQAYAPLTTPLLDADMPDQAARALVAAAKKAGALALLLPALADKGPAAATLRAAVASFKADTYAFDRHERARLDATQDGETALRSLGSKKLKELRRQRNRLADDGEVAFKIAAPGVETAAALDAFLRLEAAGWKGVSGTALAQSEGDAAFIRNAVPGLMAEGAAQIATLSSGDNVVAAGVLLRHLRRGYFFKIAYDETLAKTSPGVQITLDITRALCADDDIDDVDSIAVSNHPMIDRIWRARLAVCDLIVPTGRGGMLLLACIGLIAARYSARRIAKKFYHRIRSLKGQQS